MGTDDRARFRGDIQALRALAVGGVVVNHVWPGALPGGYVGVDVFFVISGYLITSHLQRDIARSGRVDLLAFYGRRIRRLLPAALLVTLCTIAALWAWLPFSVWSRNVGEAVASTFYVENFHLVRLSADYMAHDEAASAFQHYWSLSVEEQFYLVWPILLTAVAVVARRGSSPPRGAQRRLLGLTMVALAAVFLLSLGASIVETHRNPAAAYFLTWTRAWEFACGGLVALVALGRRGSPIVGRRPRGSVALAGWAAMAVPMVLFDERTSFPGAAALVPVLGAAAVIAAGEGVRSTPLGGVTHLRAVQFLGEISYSTYLWHWPLLVVLPYVMGGRDVRTHLVVLVFTVVLAWLTRRYVEMPGQRLDVLRRSRVAVFPVTASAMAVVAVAAWSLGHEGRGREAEAGELLAQDRQRQTCLGAAALSDRCGDPWSRPLVAPVSTLDKDFAIDDSCTQADLVVFDKKPRWDCDFSGGWDDAPRVWLVGDSHAEQLFPALGSAARAGRWRVTGIAIGGCVPFPVRQAPGGIAERSEKVCPEFGPAIDKAVRAERPDVVLLGVSSRHEKLADGSGDGQEEQYVRHLGKTARGWTGGGTTVLGVSDNPFKGGVLDAECTNQHLTELTKCAAPREEVVRPWPFERAIDRITKTNPEVRRISLADYMCDATTCRSVVGGVNLLHDTNHLSAVFSRTLGPHLRDEVLQAVPGLESD